MTNLVPTIISTVGSIVVAGIVAGVVFLGITRLDSYLNLKQIEVRSQAIDGCAQSAQNTFKTGTEGQSSEIRDINIPVYQKCLDLKNIH